jgi:hypothetical protein
MESRRQASHAPADRPNIANRELYAACGERQPGVVVHDCSLTVPAQIRHQLLERAVGQHIVADDAVLQLFVNDAV